MAALMQVVPDRDDTEIIIESTAFGYNDFNKLWRKAEAGESEFLPVFLPWSIDPEYRRQVDDSFVLDADERALMELHGLDKEQIAWRRAKISQLGSADYFAQEYPINSAEAFVSSTFDSFIPAALVIQARRGKDRPLRPAAYRRGSGRRRPRPHLDRLEAGSLHHEGGEPPWPRYDGNCWMDRKDRPRGKPSASEHRCWRNGSWYF